MPLNLFMVAWIPGIKFFCFAFFRKPFSRALRKDAITWWGLGSQKNSFTNIFWRKGFWYRKLCPFACCCRRILESLLPDTNSLKVENYKLYEECLLIHVYQAKRVQLVKQILGIRSGDGIFKLIHCIWFKIVPTEGSIERIVIIMTMRRLKTCINMLIQHIWLIYLNIRIGS